MKKASPTASFSRRILWYVVLGFSLYWLGNILAVFPWLLSKILGVITMFLSILLWAYMSYYSLRRVAPEIRNKDTVVMAIIFLLTAVIQDYLLYAVYRDIPNELYEPTTFLAYGLILLIPFIVRYIFLRKDSVGSIGAVTYPVYFVTAFIGICSLILTLWSIRFW